MSEPLKQVRIPRESMAWSKKLNLPKLVKRKSWDPAPRFKVIDNVRKTWSDADQEEMGDEPDAIVDAAFKFFGKDRELERYVLDECEQDMTEDGAWEAVTIAYAWVVLQRYNKELGGEDDD